MRCLEQSQVRSLQTPHGKNILDVADKNGRSHLPPSGGIRLFVKEDGSNLLQTGQRQGRERSRTELEADVDGIFENLMEQLGAIADS
jgi:hypothetical protein